MHTVLGKVISGYFEKKKKKQIADSNKIVTVNQKLCKKQCSMKTMLKYFLLSDKNNEDIDLVDLIM